MELVRLGNLRLKILFFDSLKLKYHIMSRILPTDKQNVSNILCLTHFFPFQTYQELAVSLFLPLEPEVTITLPDFTHFKNTHFINHKQLQKKK